MALLHKDEPVADATVDCPECGAVDWVVRRPRLGGQARIVCRACGHVDGPYFEPLDPAGSDDRRHEQGLRNLERAQFPVYVPEGRPWTAVDWIDQRQDVTSVTVTCEDPWVAVTTELAGGAPEPAEALRDAVADLLCEPEPPRGRSHAAYLLEIEQADERIDRQVSELSVERGTLRLDGTVAPCRLMRTGDVWAAYVEAGDVVVTAGAVGVPIEELALVRHG